MGYVLIKWDICEVAKHLILYDGFLGIPSLGCSSWWLRLIPSGNYYECSRLRSAELSQWH